MCFELGFFLGFLSQSTWRNFCVVCYETSVTNDQKEKYEVVSGYTDGVM